MNRSQLPMVLLLPTVLTVLVMAGGVQCSVECEGLPSTTEIKETLMNYFQNSNVSITDTQVTCLAQGIKKDTYRELSMIVLNGSDHITYCKIQLQMECTEGNNSWRYRPHSLRKLSGCGCEQDNNGYIHVQLNHSQSECGIDDSFINTKYCYQCNNSDDKYDCNSCDPACNTTGLKRCTGPTSSECCVAFNEEGTCINTTDCTIDNHEANQHNNYTCNGIYKPFSIISNNIATIISTATINQQYNSRQYTDQTTLHSFMSYTTLIKGTLNTTEVISLSSSSEFDSTNTSSTMVIIVVVLGILILCVTTGLIVIITIVKLKGIKNYIYNIRQRENTCSTKQRKNIELTTDEHNNKEKYREDLQPTDVPPLFDRKEQLPTDTDDHYEICNTQTEIEQYNNNGDSDESPLYDEITNHGSTPSAQEGHYSITTTDQAQPEYFIYSSMEMAKN